ncbi:hypothetical protein BBP40_005974 [Aspergillus hancockii]|nr:hypothetical protein BBP40_005974 [Aspergillus hancockii]
MVRWGILATGDNATKFAKDLLIDPSTRGASDITHDLVAVASSTSLQKAQEFLTTIGAPPTAKPYGSYESLLLDDTVELVYITNPHSHHFQWARAALNAGKHVLLEKAFTVNAAQARILVELAREKRLFLMEAMWTRFFPLTRNLGRDVEKLYGTEHRLVNPELAGGALLDLAIYPLTWIFQILYHDSLAPAGSARSPPSISSSLLKYAPTGVDETATVVVTFPDHQTQGVATASLRVASDPNDPSVRILGSAGQIQVFGPAARPLDIKVVQYAEGGPVVLEERGFGIPVGHGLFWEADECVQCLAEGRLESDVMPLDETIVILEVLDKVREQNGLRYPESIEAS